ncbi:hypothetical protein PPTG_12813 [Phytophthora nicotianae INRA-310]|uniref:Uncharacterized protein n=1 Tax=Phytophthora nicotianae (strain INRA-310) TaxID=761204 RepID=W2Q120_PHYN3|nr:hypothetical protein PPTG_12813 [Phytophthora nicotianae INRA-310]ETN06787.1 hypothetical protein PPTG_12813 [Phytophthora nicotianae INRA-310]
MILTFSKFLKRFTTIVPCVEVRRATARPQAPSSAHVRLPLCTQVFLTCLPCFRVLPLLHSASNRPKYARRLETVRYVSSWVLYSLLALCDAWVCFLFVAGPVVAAGTGADDAVGGQVQKTIGWPQFVCAIAGSIQYLQVAADLCLDNQRSTVKHPARLRKQLQLHNVPPQLRVYDFDLDSKGRHRS